MMARAALQRIGPMFVLHKPGTDSSDSEYFSWVEKSCLGRASLSSK